jgi:adenine specific DNA methylase Mod
MTKVPNRALGAVRLGRNRDMGTEKRMNDILAKVGKLNAVYAEMSEKALELYAADEDKGNQNFKHWTQQNVRS